jgi:mono/diheme cytochrome c family protein
MNRFALLSLAGLTLGLIGTSASVQTQAPQATPPSSSVTFTKDVAPILQQHCIVCHRPGEVAPMPLRTFDEARPWAASMKRRVQSHEMPPWFVDRSIGIKEYENDPSLTDAEIATIAKWVDAGAPQGNPADMPAQPRFASPSEWTLGKPDLLIVESKEFEIPAAGADQFVNFEMPSGLTEDRWIRAIEAKPTVAGRRVVHHSITSAIQEPIPGYKSQADSDTNLRPGQVRDPAADEAMYLIEFVPGTTPDVYPEGTGRLIKAGAKLRINTHYHSVGEMIRDHMEVAMWFYPKGYVPKYQVQTMRVRPLAGPDNNYLDIPPGAAHERFDGYYRLEKPAEVVSFEPHMHYRGEAMSLEAILPDGHSVQLTSVPHFDWAWQIAYSYKTKPVFPAGTMLHTIAYFNNSLSNKKNPDPSAWVGFGQRTIDEMSNGWTDFVYIDEADFQKAVSEGRAPGTSPRMSNNN